MLRQIGLHDHLALIYESKEEQVAAAIPAIRTGIEPREKCVYVADENATRDVIGRVLVVDEQGKTSRLIGERVDIDECKQAEHKILAQLDELRRWQEVTLGREYRVLEFQREVNKLRQPLGEPARHASQTQP